MKLVQTRRAALMTCIALASCGKDMPQTQTPPLVGAGTGGTGTVAGLAGSIAQNTAGAGTSAVNGSAGRASVPPATGGRQAPSTAGMPGPTSAGAGASAAGMMASAGATASAGTMAMAGSAGSAGMAPVASGPKDGDPGKPVVAIAGIPCGPAQNAAAGGNHMIGGRDLLVEYPCEKHEGAHVTVILNLHGTLISNAPWQYQHAYFSAHRFVTSHNLIVLTPHSVSKASSGAQWGNMDNGEDLPHLLAVIDWAYQAFAKYEIRGLWVGGHSWGAGFVASTLGGGPLACHPMLADKVKGAIGMSRLGMPSCANRLSLIGTRGEEENIALSNQAQVAMEHGCMSPMKGPEKLGNNDYYYFEGCNRGWVHEDYEMLGKGHIDSMDEVVVKKIVESIKSTEAP